LRISNSCISNIFNERLDISTGEYNQVVVPGITRHMPPLLSCYLPSHTRCNVAVY